MTDKSISIWLDGDEYSYEISNPYKTMPTLHIELDRMSQLVSECLRHDAFPEWIDAACYIMAREIIKFESDKQADTNNDNF